MFKKLLLGIAIIFGLSSVSFAALKTNRMQVDYGVLTSTLQVTTGAGSGKVLTSDAAGNATWQTPSTGITDHAQLTSTGTLTHSQLEAKITSLETSTSTLAGQVSQEVIDRINADNLIGAATGQLSIDVGNKVDKSGDTMTGDLTVPNVHVTYGVDTSTVNATGKIKTTSGIVQLGEDATTNSWKTERVGSDLVTYFYDGSNWVEAFRAVP